MSLLHRFDIIHFIFVTVYENHKLELSDVEKILNKVSHEKAKFWDLPVPNFPSGNKKVFPLAWKNVLHVVMLVSSVKFTIAGVNTQQYHNYTVKSDVNKFLSPL